MMAFKVLYANRGELSDRAWLPGKPTGPFFPAPVAMGYDMSDDYHSYYSRRAGRAHDMAARATEPNVRAIHLALAQGYAELAHPPAEPQIMPLVMGR